MFQTRVETSTQTQVDFKRVPGILLLPGYLVYFTLINKTKAKQKKTSSYLDIVLPLMEHKP